MPLYDDSCCGFTLTAIASGDTTATVQFGNMSASAQISAYLPLKACVLCFFKTFITLVSY